MSLSHAQNRSFGNDPVWISQRTVQWTPPLVYVPPSSPIASHEGCISPSSIHHQSPPCVGNSISQPDDSELRESRESVHPVGRQGRRNESGCVTCRIRHKKCSLELDKEKRCADCKSLNIECLRGYWEGYPPGLKDQNTKKECLREIKEWTRVNANRALPKPLCLQRFCQPSSSAVNPTHASTASGSVSGNMTLALGGAGGYNMPVSPTAQSDSGSSIIWSAADSDEQVYPEMHYHYAAMTSDSLTFRHEANTGSYQLPSPIPADGDMTILRDQAVAYTAIQYHTVRGAPGFIESPQYPANTESEVDPSTCRIAGSACEGMWGFTPAYPSC